MANREMKYSGVEWIGEIPKRWEVMKFKYVMKKDKKIAKKYNNENVISLTKSGVIIRDLENPFGKMPASFDGYQHVEEGDLLLCLFDIDVTPRCVGIVKNNGVTSPAYSRYKLMDGFDINYYNYLLTYLDDEKILLSYTKSLRNTLTDEYFGAVSTIKPSLLEQQKIAAFLDGKVAHINNIIEDTKKSIENLKAYKQSLITETVTKGLDPNIEMKDSGIEWIGDIPKHWRVTKVKNFVQIKNGKDNKVKDGEIPVYGSGGVFGKTDQIMYKKASVLLGRKGTIDSPKYIEKPFWAVDTTFYTIAKPNVALKFFYYLMKSIDYKKYTYGSAIPSMSQSILNEIKLPYTNLDEQKQIAIFLDDKTSHVDSLIEQKEQLVAELESYKKSLIYEYVTGKKEVK